MNIYKYHKCADDLWNIIGSFGEFDTSVNFEDNLFSAENGAIAVKSEVLRYDNGVCVRKGTVKNVSDEEVSLNTLSMRFTLDGGEYDVYSQASFWQNESEGCWNTLNTTVSAYSKSVRNSCGAALCIPDEDFWTAGIADGPAHRLHDREGKTAGPGIH